MHLVARRAKESQIVGDIVLSVAVKVANFQNFNDSKTAMHAINAVVIMPKGQLAIVDALCVHSFFGGGLSVTLSNTSENTLCIERVRRFKRKVNSLT